MEEKELNNNNNNKEEEKGEKELSTINSKIVYKKEVNTDKINQQESKIKNKLRLNIAIIGKRKCGKSALILSYLKKSFENDNKDTTLDIFGKNILISGNLASLVISEVSQDKSNFSLAKEILSAAHIIFICYSLEDDFEKINEDIIEGSIGLIKTVDPKIPIFIVGCKFDLIKEENIDNKKIINENELTINGKNIQEYIKNKKESLGNNFCGYYITSSLLNLNIQELFNDAIKTVAMPYAKKYQKKKKEREMNAATININLENCKIKKNSVAQIINYFEEEKEEEIQVDQTGCIIF
jgi:GTPase SAR1 family protein